MSEDALQIVEKIRDMKGKGQVQFSSAVHMHSAHKLNKQGDNIQP